MNTLTALFKKELHTAKWFLLGGTLFFWSFPLLEGTRAYFRSGTFQTDMPSVMSLVFGALFAIITACGMVCMDMPKGLYEFWRSRPVKLLPYMAIKYVVGLAVVLFVITVPVLLETYLFRNADYSNSFQRSILCCHTFVILLIYSVAFCAGHLFRNTTETVIISCAAALLIYFIPVLVPAMESLSFFNNIVSGEPAPTVEIVAKLGPNETPKSSIYPRTNWGYSFCGDCYMYWMPISSKSLLIVFLSKGFWLFTGTMTALSVVLIAGTWVCLKYHLQIRMGPRSLCWSLGLVGLILFSAAAFSVASNLKCLAKISFPAWGERVFPIIFCFDNKGGVVLCGRYNSGARMYDMLQIDRISEGPSYTYRKESYPLETSLPSQGLFYDSQRIAWSKQAPDIVYFLGTTDEPEQGKDVLRRYSLYVIKLDDGTHTARVLGELPTGEYDAEKWKYYSEGIALDYPTLYLLMPKKVAVVDVSDDKQPRLLTKFAYQAGFSGGENGKTFSLPSDKTLSEEQRRRIAQHFSYELRARAWDGDRYVEGGYDSICVYEKKETGNEKIRLGKIAERKLPPLEKLMYRGPRKLILHDDIVYSLCNGSSLMVYRLNESSGTLKSIGHYAASESRFYDMILRDDGRIALIGENQIHIVQPPAVKGR